MNTRLRLLRQFLAACLFLAAVLPLQAVNWQTFTISVPIGRMGHHFDLGGPSPLEPVSNLGPDLNYFHSGSTDYSRLSVLLDADREYTLWDTTANEALPLLPASLGISTDFDFRTGTWQNSTGVPRMYFLTDANRSGNALILHSLERPTYGSLRLSWDT